MSDTNAVTCPGCQTRYKVANEVIGRRIRCTKCGTKFTTAAEVPASDAEPFDPQAIFNQFEPRDPEPEPESETAPVAATIPAPPPIPPTAEILKPKRVDQPKIHVPNGGFEFAGSATIVLLIGGFIWSASMDRVINQHGQQRFKDEYAEPASANALEYIQRVIQGDVRPFVIAALLALILVSLRQINASIRFHTRYLMERDAGLQPGESEKEPFTPL